MQRKIKGEKRCDDCFLFEDCGIFRSNHQALRNRNTVYSGASCPSKWGHVQTDPSDWERKLWRGFTDSGYPAIYLCIGPVSSNEGNEQTLCNEKIEEKQNDRKKPSCSCES